MPARNGIYLYSLSEVRPLLGAIQELHQKMDPLPNLPSLEEIVVRHSPWMDIWLAGEEYPFLLESMFRLSYGELLYDDFAEALATLFDTKGLHPLMETVTWHN